MKTNFDKLIARFIDAKFESTKGMSFEEGGESWPGKQANTVIVFYLL
jgi:hypothetical protein